MPRPLNVIIGMERSGIVRDAFRRLGHEAWSCDLIGPDHDEWPRETAAGPQEWPNYHYEGDVRWYTRDGLTPWGEPWDIAIFHTDCTFFTNSAAWALRDPDFERYPGVGYHQRVKPETLTGAARRAARETDAALVRELKALPIKRKCFENPRGYMSTILGAPTQAIQPNWFGHDASKETCLWLEDLPPLHGTRYILPRMVGGKPRWANQTDSGQNCLSPGAGRAMARAETYRGVADAMAAQWGGAVS